MLMMLDGAISRTHRELLRRYGTIAPEVDWLIGGLYDLQTTPQTETGACHNGRN